jgi:hypothetical protein
MKKVMIVLISLLLTFDVAVASKKDDTRMKAAEQALSDGKYIDAKTTFEDLKDVPQYRQKCYLYLAMIYNQNGQIDNSRVALNDFGRYTTSSTDLSLIKSAENLKDELDKSYGNLDIAIFPESDKSGITPGAYNLFFRSDGGLSTPQEARLKLLNKILAQSGDLMSWGSDGSFLKGRISNFPIRLFDTTPMTAEVNGVPFLFRFDFQTKQGLWIPNEILGSRFLAGKDSITYRESPEPLKNAIKPKSHFNAKILVIGIAVIAAGVAVALTK